MNRTKYYHTDEVADILGITIEEVRAMLNNGELRGHKQGKRWLIVMDQPGLEDMSVSKEQNNSFIQYVKDLEHADIIANYARQVKHTLYIATADFKNVYLHKRPLVEILNSYVDRGIDVQVICWSFKAEQTPRFKLVECTRSHMKMVIFDESLVYIGSANLTQAALTKRVTKTNNHEAGIITNNHDIVKQALSHFKEALKADDCKTCRKKKCKFRSDT